MIRATQDYLRGEWLLVRIVKNVPEESSARSGVRRIFTQYDEGLTCREQDILRFGGADYHTRADITVALSRAGRVAVRPADGRPFHDFLTRGPSALAIDEDDRYEIVYHFEPRTWISRWRMLGPGRNQVMTRRYRR